MSKGAKDHVAAGYDTIVERYAAWQSQVLGDPRERYVQKLLSLIPERSHILEMGCGSGIEPTPTFARRGRLVGIDISRAQIDRARAAVPEAEFIHADVTTATFAAGSFDAVVALFTLTHIPGADLPGLLRNVGQWLRTGGAFLGTFGSGSRHEAVVADWLGAPMFFSGFEEETNERLVREAGLTILEAHREPMSEPESEPGRGRRPSPSTGSSPRSANGEGHSGGLRIAVFTRFLDFRLASRPHG